MTNLDSKKLLVATFNSGKLREFQDYLGGLALELIGLESLSEVSPSPEDGHTFEQNARQKAIYYTRFCSSLTLADDSGLVVDALGGEPGIHSARYLSPSASDHQRCLEVLARLRNTTTAMRTARFVCCLALARQGAVIETFEGTVDGIVASEPRGSHGFGYDPIFWLPELGQTMAELSATEKLAVSHRGQALRKMSEYLRARVQ